MTGTRIEVAGRWYRRGKAFYSNWCCKLHPAWQRAIVGYELEAEGHV